MLLLGRRGRDGLKWLRGELGIGREGLDDAEELPGFGAGRGFWGTRAVTACVPRRGGGPAVEGEFVGQQTAHGGHIGKDDWGV